MKNNTFILIIAFLLCCSCLCGQGTQKWKVEDIITDIYSLLTENGEAEDEDLQATLVEIAAHPFNINQITESQLQELRFLDARQIDAILVYVDRHALVSKEELYLIGELDEWDVRNLQVFVYIGEAAEKTQPSIKEVFSHGTYDVVTRVDARNVEHFDGDPVYVQGTYKFNYDNRVQFGVRLQRPAGGGAETLAYGGYVQLNDIHHLKSLTLGNFQAQFGQGLVMSYPFHTGKNNYVTTAGMAQEGVKKYSSVNGEGLHGIGSTLTFDLNKGTLDATVLYSLTRPNADLQRHTIGANITWQYNRGKIGLTAAEHLYSDTLGYYRNMEYNRNYFRGKQQAIIGLNGRYNWGRVDWFGEVAVAQNTRWGVGLNTGVRYTPINDVHLLALYRYYSPMFDNVIGYGFSETNRINDENGGYIGIEVKRIKHWILSAYGDVFYFDGIKYGIPYAPSWGYDAVGQATWQMNSQSTMWWKIRAKEKARLGTYSLRYQYNWQKGCWRLRTEANANIVADSVRNITWGATLHQDIQYTWEDIPLTLQGRVILFYIRDWNNRIYTYENDVLYGYSVPAMYGQGGRIYLNLRWTIQEWLSLYLRVSETVYTKNWADLQSKAQSDTDIHLLLRMSINQRKLQTTDEKSNTSDQNN